MGRTSDARRKILDTARSLIEMRGYSALGVAEICKAAGVPKGSFYYFFESKEALALAVLDEHWAAERRGWTSLLADGTEPPLQRLHRLFEATEAEHRTCQEDHGTIAGCMLGNLSLEMCNQSEAVRDRLKEIFEDQVDMIEAVVTEAQGRGEIAVADIRESARAVVAQLEGQVLFAKLYNTTSPLGVLWANCLALLNTRPAGS
ncbi:TetR/AcrR family transcriptional regulator [Streptomyces sp. NPDC004457]|uniref:TetR/AcrR family transcriptional regulator n=1 Tax=Streptomyces spinosus TaxID=2872623 RepID=UPI001CECE27A|nr:TetR/AcrR family transcriptional regulator [Streptomyces spinosus]